MSTTRLIRVEATGGPEVLRWAEGPLPPVGPGQARIRHRFAGLNFIDVYHRTGLYAVPLPFTPGVEGAGEVLEVGAGVTWVKPGDRVAYAGGGPGAYSVERVMPAERLVPLPPAIDERTAAAMMLKGMTAQMLLRQTTRIERGDTILVHAAAGGVGLILCQWAHHLGATVIGTVGSDEKAALARAHGCDHTIVYTRENFVDRVKELTGGKGVRVAYDSVGKDTFLGSMDCLQVRGLLVLYGNASGPAPAFEPLLLAQKGCLYVTRPILFAYTPTRQAVLDTAGDLFAVVASGAVKIPPPRSFPLAEAAEAHRALEGRRTVGSTVLEAG
jgi:NADPH2:quinone reductase